MFGLRFSQYLSQTDNMRVLVQFLKVSKHEIDDPYI